MTATVDAVNIDTVLRRANRELSREIGEPVLSDYQLGELADTLREHYGEPTTTNQTDIQDALKQQHQAELEQLRSELEAKREALSDAHRGDVMRLREQLNSVEIERDKANAESARLADELAATQQTQPHRCAYPLDGPDQLPGPCECGKPFPQPWRRQGHPDQSPAEPDAWTALFDQIRQELSTTDRKGHA